MNAQAIPFDVAALADYLRQHVKGFGGPLEVTRFPGGQSNPTFLLTTPGRRYAMRTKPAPVAQLLPSAHAIEREYRVQKALATSTVPVAGMHCLCEDETIIGRAFYVMDHVDGRIFWEQSLPQCDPAERAALYAELNRVMAALHTVDVAALGLADYGKPGNYFQRQIGRWERQYRASQTRQIDAMEKLIAWLPQHIPQEDEPRVSLVHGDYRIDNVIFHPTEPRILAVIDWELSTLGHPLADFAYHLMSWNLPPEPFRGLHGLDLTSLGIPDEASYVATYEQRTGCAFAGNREFCLAYNMFRLAAIIQGIVKRAEEGIATNPQALDYARRRVEPLAELGWSFARKLSQRS